MEYKRMGLAGYLKSQLLFPLAEANSKRHIREKVETLRFDLGLSPILREERKRHQLHKILCIAGQKIPYYKDLFKSLQFSPDLILNDIRHLQALPFLDKEIITEQGNRMLNEDFAISELHERKTGGSTGISTRIYYDNEALDWTAAVSRYAQLATGRRPSDLELVLNSLPVTEGSLKNFSIAQLKDLAMNRVSIQTRSLSDSDLSTLWKRICKLRPYLIQGHPSTLYALALFVQNSALRFQGAFQVFESTGESLDSYKTRTICEQLGCRIHNRYGTAEFGVTAESTVDSTQLEVIDYIIHHETVSLGNGLEEIIGTTTTNTAMPLIRYRSGDIGELKHEANKTLIINLQGRVHDLIEIDGKPYPTHFVKGMLDRIGGVDEFQIVLKRNGSKVMNLVISDESKLPLIESEVTRFSKGSLIVRSVKFENLVRVGLRDKLRYVVKEV